jgi:Family of unknown function (DUF6260)
LFVDNYIPLPAEAGVQSDAAPLSLNMFAGRSFDPGLRRPYYDKHDRPCVTVNTGRWTVEKGRRRPIRERRLLRDLILEGVVPPVFNATALRKEEWIELDKKVVRATRYRLRAVGDLQAASSYGGFNGMGKMLLEHETMSDPGEAIVDMDGMTQGRNDSPKFQLEGLPLPITHSDFFYDARRLAISRNTGTPLDMTTSEAGGRRIGEMLEKTLIGVNTGITYGGNSTQTGGYGRTSAVYGYTNFPTRIIKNNINTPTGANASSTLSDVLAMRDLMYANKFFGPFMLYTSNDWDQYLDNDYILTGGNVATQTLRNRIRSIGGAADGKGDGIQDVRRLDFLFGTAPQTNPYYTSSTVGTTGIAVYKGPGGDVDASLKPFTLILVQMTEEVARWVNGMDITTLQWESMGGMRVNFKIMCIQVPQLRADHYGNCGILHGTTS